MNLQKIKIFNGKLILPNRILPNGTVIIEDGKILFAGEENIETDANLKIDARGNYISPGFIDIHIHGGGGHDFMDQDKKAFLEIAKMHAKHGTTAMSPTTLTADKESILKSLRIYEDARVENNTGADFIGMHLEGPYLAMSQKGAQDPKYIRDPNPDEYREIIDSSKSVIRWSAAPELRGALEFGKYLHAKKILPSIAHTDAIYEEVEKAFDVGYTHITHLYSAMSGITRRNAFRYAGVIESAFLIDDMTVEIIADGIHVPGPLLKLVYKIKGADKIALITDAMRGAGMPPGPSILGGRQNGVPVIIEDDVAKLPDRSFFAGSVATCDRLVRNMVKLADLPLYEAVRMMTLTPAAIMGIENEKGSLQKGKHADLVIFDDEFNVECTIVRGNVIFSRPPIPA
ncbi:MAG: N-acetylglucosamine-6-phosphate deacetylase [Bacteroidetes bacterium]|nr:MAG: N-acetylglucosamine-6-phosphate deacetylase [Bacteroidota bacterium]